MITVTNSFHATEAHVRGDVGSTVSWATVLRVRRALCGIRSCTCGDTCGARDSRYTLDPVASPPADAIIRDNRED